MRVRFHKTGERRYAVSVWREGQPELRMDPAPGFDPLMPHDLQHFIVEQALNIGGGIFGQLAQGGTANTFRDAAAYDRRGTRKREARGARLAAEGQDDSLRSERATYLCWHHWLNRRADAASRTRAAEMAETASSMWAGMPAAERARYDTGTLDEVARHMDACSADWAAVPIGGFIELDWHERAAPRPLNQRQRHGIRTTRTHQGQ